jgi:DNA-directed RNA polymerase specialized sigma24 family protein
MTAESMYQRCVDLPQITGRGQNEGEFIMGQPLPDRDFMAFYAARFDEVRVFVRSQCADEAIVDNVVHHTFIAALGAWPKIGLSDNPTEWLTKTARTKLSHVLKRTAARNGLR